MGADTVNGHHAAYRDLVESSSDGILILDAEGVVRYANGAAGVFLGRAESELLGRPPGIHFAAGRPEDLRVTRPGGEPGYAEIRVTEAQWGEQPARIVTLHDITERRRAEERVGYLARLFEENPNPALRVSPGGAVLCANPAGETLLAAWGTQVGGRLPEEVRRAIGESAVGKAGCLLDVEAGGRAFSFVVSPRPVGGDLNLYGQDMTERRRLEEQLRQAQKLDAIGRLAGGMAHDFNNILTIIGGYADFLLHAMSPDDPDRSHVEQIRKAATRGGALTRPLLTFGRRQDLQPRAIRIGRVVADLEPMLRRLIGEDIELVVAATLETGPVVADPGQIRQVLLNLAANARDAMPRGGRLVIETADVMLDAAYARGHADVKPGPYVRLAVSDTGCGMSRETSARLFEPFFTTKQPGQGTGFGLSIVYGIVKQSGGHIAVYSEPGQGTTFKIHLPRTARRVEESAVLPAVVPGRGSESILLVEDEQEIRDLLVRTLEGNGYRVVAEPDGMKALARIEAEGLRADLLITDVVLPRMGGRELAGRLTRAHPALKVLFMSGYTDTALAQHGILEVNAPLLMKPFALDDMLQKVRSVLDTNGCWHPSEGPAASVNPA
jgi:signal transduction histidine kinase/CheY-like chemotaxis protein